MTQRCGRPVAIARCATYSSSAPSSRPAPRSAVEERLPMRFTIAPEISAISRTTAMISMKVKPESLRRFTGRSGSRVPVAQVRVVAVAALGPVRSEGEQIEAVGVVLAGNAVLERMLPGIQQVGTTRVAARQVVARLWVAARRRHE